jgi:hypothetical protein
MDEFIDYAAPRSYRCDGCHARSCTAIGRRVRESCPGWVRLVEANLGIGVPADHFFCGWACVGAWAAKRDRDTSRASHVA